MRENEVMPPIRTAVLGFGLAGRIFHCPFITAVPGLELEAIVQRSGNTAAAAYPEARILRSVEEAFTDSSLDVIVVATPNDTHYSLAHAALSAGKHVVIDKPFAATSQQARELITLAAAKSRVLAPFHNRRYDADFLTLRQLLAESRLGRVTQVHSHYDRFRPQQRPNTWKETQGPANGLLYDLGPHLVDQALALFGPPATLSASIRSERDRTEIDDAFDLLLTWHGDGAEAPGLRYTCSATMLAASPAPRFRAHGSFGSFVKHGLDPQEAALLAGARPPQSGSEEPWLPEAEAAWGTLTTATAHDPSQLESVQYPSLTGDYRHFYEGVRDAIADSRALPIPAEDGYRVIRLLEIARESHRLGRTLDVLL
jgi:scyllo-inositol 2-dehydrogenase (NADP+)